MNSWWMTYGLNASQTNLFNQKALPHFAHSAQVTARCWGLKIVTNVISENETNPIDNNRSDGSIIAVI